MPPTRSFCCFLLMGCSTLQCLYGAVWNKAEEDLEYDASVMDPHHADGTPYGGFSRATRQRLSQLPLILDESSIESEEDRYFKMRDDSGQMFACRLYPEDELEPKSLTDSMFDYPMFRKKVNEPEKLIEGDKSSSETSVNSLGEALTARSAPRTRVLQHQQNKPKVVNKSSNLQHSSSSKGTTTTPSSEAQMNIPSTEKTTEGGSKSPQAGVSGGSSGVPTTKDSDDSTTDPMKVQRTLQEKLARICGQIHKGDMTQFHIEYDKRKNTVTVENNMVLGTFQRRILQTRVEELPPNEWIGDDATEVARVVDVYDNGAVCGDKDPTPRKAYVHMQCCSDEVLNKVRSMIHRDGRQLTTAVAGVLSVIEEPTCSYNVTVCTPLLCGAAEDELVEDDLEEDELLKALNFLPEVFTAREDESVVDILDRSLSQVRLQTNPGGGWWSYEMSHRKSVKQYHEVAGVRQSSSGVHQTANVRESEHVLGKYDPASAPHITKENEWQHIVNATAGGTSWGEGNGAYYEVEYTGGDVCDDSDVTDHGLVAVERATTVRYYCGDMFDLQVREDTTCHYVVDVKVPSLCAHPLFRAPVSKKQIMKCLPVDET